ADGGLTSGPGTGPAMEYAQVGFAGAQIDGPLWGERNTTGGDEDLLIFNLQNLPALRDNLRQAALELTLHPALLAALSIDVGDCHVRMEQGIVDHYILPSIANAMSLSLGLDLAGPDYDDDPEYVDQQRARDVLTFSGHGRVALPSAGRVVVQHRGDGVLDGHE